MTTDSKNKRATLVQWLFAVVKLNFECPLLQKLLFPFVPPPITISNSPSTPVPTLKKVTVFRISSTN